MGRFLIWIARIYAIFLMLSFLESVYHSITNSEFVLDWIVISFYIGSAFIFSGIPAILLAYFGWNKKANLP